MISRMGRLISSSKMTLDQVKVRFPQWFIAKLEENQELLASYPFYDSGRGQVDFTTVIGDAKDHKEYLTTITCSKTPFQGKEIVTVRHESIIEIGILKSLSINFLHSKDAPINIEGDIYRFLFPETNV